MKCNKCGGDKPNYLSMPLENGYSYAMDWAFDWCPWCVEKELEAHYESKRMFNSSPFNAANVGRFE